MTWRSPIKLSWVANELQGPISQHTLLSVPLPHTGVLKVKLGFLCLLTELPPALLAPFIAGLLYV